MNNEHEPNRNLVLTKNMGFRVNIAGLTDMTISFSGLGLILRGKTELRNIEVKSDDQMREIIGIKNAKLISVEEQAEKAPVAIKLPKEIKMVLEEDKSESPAIPQSKTQKTIKRVAKSEESDKPLNSFNAPPPPDDEGEIVIMTESGARKGKGKRNMAGEIKESEATKASIEALKQLEDEERGELEEEQNRKPIDESKLPLNERMGEKATIAFGSRNTQAVEMKNSIIPEAEQIKNAKKFIPMEEKTLKQKEAERVKSAFIDRKDEDQEDDNDDNDDLIET